MGYLTDDLAAGTKLKVGMVGGGRGAFFAGYHRAAMRLTNRFDIVAGAFSSDPAVSRQAGEALGVAADRIYPDATAMARAEAGRQDGIDVAVIVTPNHLHYEACRAFVGHGTPVICDKPLVNALGEASMLAGMVSGSDLFFALTYTYRGYPMVRDARERILAGEIGELRFLYAEYLLEWGAADVSTLGAKGGRWRDDPARAGPTGSIGDVGIHAFDLMEFVSGRRCTEVSARLSRLQRSRVLDDTGVIQLAFEGGVEGLLWTTQAAPGHRNGLRFKFVGSTGTLDWSQEAPETLRLGHLGRGDITYRRGQSDMSPAAATSASLPAGNPEGYLEALAVLYADFAAALRAGPGWRRAIATPLPDIVAGWRGVALTEAALDSDGRRSWVPFPESLTDMPQAAKAEPPCPTPSVRPITPREHAVGAEPESQEEAHG